ncbi:phosphotransferase system HPr (HPr) family protein [Saccharomonospora marina XMU15]|uniref:Phosphotransferase system HPr (HPr) family protein n=1 Tax=Saccharomonospora marina XMU15 TaxID=882083 RepID=H5WXW5_9PSEU|nr:HPr family phosphocarrier protein [Saccharomonospora marina]EHR51774.1 phosphotransferase system HPr (HPr) family protein [Saccharomonospora marina XMU15]
MPSRDVVVGSRIGLHGRPAAIVARTAAAQPVPVRIRVGQRPAVNAASVISVLALGATGGDTVTIEAEGEGAEQALDTMAALLAQDLDAEDKVADAGHSS